MPVTIRLSRQFTETFGEEVTNELVEWFNQVDTTYRLELREQNELNFARFDARLEQRLAEFGAELRTEFRTALGELRIELHREIADLRTEFHAALGAGLGDLRKELDGRISGLEGLLHRELAGLRTDLIKWMFVFWATTALAVLGLALR